MQRILIVAVAVATAVGIAGCVSSANGTGAQDASKIDPQSPVIVYGSNTCTECYPLTDHLRRRGVVHLEKDVQRMPGAAAEMNAALAHAGVSAEKLPVLNFRGVIVVGYDPEAVDRLCSQDVASQSAMRSRLSRAR